MVPWWKKEWSGGFRLWRSTYRWIPTILALHSLLNIPGNRKKFLNGARPPPGKRWLLNIGILIIHSLKIEDLVSESRQKCHGNQTERQRARDQLGLDSRPFSVALPLQVKLDEFSRQHEGQDDRQQENQCGGRPGSHLFIAGTTRPFGCKCEYSWCIHTCQRPVFCESHR